MGQGNACRESAQQGLCLYSAIIRFYRSWYCIAGCQTRERLARAIGPGYSGAWVGVREVSLLNRRPQRHSSCNRACPPRIGSRRQDRPDQFRQARKIAAHAAKPTAQVADTL